MTLRTRFLIAIVAVVAILAVTNVVTYASMRTRLRDRLDAQLESAAVALTEAATPLVDAAGQATPDLRRLDALAPVGSVVEVQSADGAVVATVGRTGAIVVDGGVPAAGTTGDRTIDGARWRVESIPIGAAAPPAGGPKATAPGPRGLLVIALPLEPVDATLRNLLGIELAASIAVVLALAAVGFWLWRLGLRPIERIALSAGKIAAGDLEQRIPDGDARSEVGRLSAALNAMLDEVRTSITDLQASEGRLRRFVSDASHELRTPLTAIRGYADLYRAGDLPGDDDVQRAMQRIDESSERMTVLVDELLLLARLDQGRPLERIRVDLTAVVGDALIDAAAIEPTRPLELDAPAAVLVLGDHHRLAQVVANLLANVRVHTPTDTPVRVGVHADGDDAVLVVHDAGPGIPVDVLPHVFDRFYRASDARGRHDGGTGLGLSIVAAVVRAHDGDVTVVSPQGGGTTFTVRLPVERDAPLRELRGDLQVGSRPDPQP